MRAPGEVVAECFRAFAARDADRFVALVHPDVTWRPASALFAFGDSPATEYRGHSGIRRWFSDVSAWSGYTVRTLQFEESGEMVFVPAVATLAIEATWLTRTVYYVFRVRDGRVAELTSWTREDPARSRSGLPPARATLSEHATAGELRIPADPAQLARVRATLREAAGDVGLDAVATNDVLVAVTEAITNALTHGRPDENDTIEVKWGIEEGMLVVCIGDCGRYQAAETLDPDREDYGRGMAVMRLLVDDLTVEAHDQGTLVRLAKQVPA